MVFSEDGTILDCGPRREVRNWFPTVQEQHYEAILIPGFINTHCHLELSHLRGQLQPGGGLPSFVRQVMELRNTNPQRIELGIQEGLEELQREGVVGLVDIGNTGKSLANLQKSGLYGLFLLELIKFDPDSAERIFEQGRAFLNRQDHQESLPREIRIITGLTGHATYSCSEVLLRKVSAHAVQTEAPVSLHLLESLEERTFIEQGKGFFAKYVEQLGYALDAWKAPGIGSLLYAEHCLGPTAKRLYVHLVHIRKEELPYLVMQPNT
ncbi:MAG: amidohydrolase family protein, partial [Nitrospira sp.]|nr:amidohydrolase family protein [Nitrospira sp.]